MLRLYIEDQDHNVFSGAVRTCHFVYAHGKLQRRVGYDLVNHGGDFNSRKTRMEDVTAVLPDGKEIPSTLFYWNRGWGYCGLVVQKGDTKAMEYAQRMYEERAKFI